MRAGLLITASLLAGFATSVFAADLPSRRAAPGFVPPPIPVFSWTGFYIGAQVGYEFGRDRVSAPGIFPAFGYGPSGVVGGAHVGYLYQFDQIVVGVEGDVNGADYRGNGRNSFNGASLTSQTPIDGSARGRLGFALDRALFYATGGAAFASIKDTYLDRSGVSALSRGRVGWTAGGGVEYAVTPEWLLRAEYRYTDYGSFGELPGVVIVPRVNHDTDNRVQVGVSYKFGGVSAVPVVARY